jgi:hypothetical protein
MIEICNNNLIFRFPSIDAKLDRRIKRELGRLQEEALRTGDDCLSDGEIEKIRLQHAGHPHTGISVDLQRTLRIPDDGGNYPLPPGFGSFPLRHLDDFSSRMPPHWLERGGVIFPIYQYEAL